MLPAAFRWAMPAIALLLGLFAQSAGLYFGTRSYVRRMDELHRPAPLPPTGLSAAGLGLSQQSAYTAGTLPDVLSPPVLPGRLMTWGVLAMDIVATCIPILWAACVMRSRDLRLWTRTLLAGCLLASLKGLLTWATVLPDTQGWEGCRARLGVDGLKYYRREVDVIAGAVPRELRLADVAEDILFLEIRGLWPLGGGLHSQFCAESSFGTGTYACILFCFGLYEASRSSWSQLEGRWSAAAKAATAFGLALAVLGTVALAVVRRRHYTLDLAMSLVLVPLVFTSPAVALAAECWICKASSKVAIDRSAASGSPASASPTSPSAVSVVGEGSQEVGRVGLPPCSVPFCTVEGVYYLRTEPVRLDVPLDEQAEEERRQRQLDHFAEMKENLQARLRRKEELLRKERADARESATAAAVAAEQRAQEVLAEQARLLAEEERQEFLKAERAAAEQLGEKVGGQ